MAKIGYSKRAGSTVAYALIAEGWNELVQDGFTPELVGTAPVKADTEVIYAVSDDGDYVGVLTWQHHRELDVYEVTLGYVEPSSRQRHVFTQMFSALLARAGTASVASILIPIAPENTVAKVVIEKLKGKPVSVVYEHVVA